MDGQTHTRKRVGGEVPALPRTYGRRKAHALSARQEHLLAALLPRLAIDLEKPPLEGPLGAHFANAKQEVWLEIGFGAGEHLIAQAKANPDVLLIGAEPYVNGVASLLSAIAKDEASGAGRLAASDNFGGRTKGIPFESANRPFAYVPTEPGDRSRECAAIPIAPANIRIHPGDARDLVAWLPAASIARVFVLFPDPWPKKRHHKRRLIAAPFARALARVMASGAELRFASDVADYAEAAFEALAATGCFHCPPARPLAWQERPDDWPETRYEKKARRAGRSCYYLRFVRKPLRP